jgi:glycosyltransferase involved in cell wall biosynthesis
MPNNKPVVSVILPVHRNDQFTKLSVESMLNQDFQDLEILLIKSNNFEFDESLEITIDRSDEVRKVSFNCVGNRWAGFSA